MSGNQDGPLMKRDESWTAFGKTFKIRKGDHTQTVRLQSDRLSGQSDGDTFSFRLPANSLKKSDECLFNAIIDLEALKKWLTKLHGNDESATYAAKKLSQSKNKRSAKKNGLFLEPQPFLQNRDLRQSYSDRFVPFRSLCTETVHRLLSMQSTAVHTPSPAVKMLFPQRRLGSVRVSEQEARFQFCMAAEDSGTIAWAVEVPTTRSYRQKAKSEDGLSGRTDVALFEYAEKWQRILNIEFKAGRASVADFAKDLEQLVREQIPGAWFHLLTRPTHLDFVASNMTKGLKAAIRVPLEKREELFQVDIDIAICVLNEITWGSGISVGADLYLKRIEYRRPNPECFDLEDFDRKIEEELKNPGRWERQHFAPAAGSVGAERV